MKRKKFPLPLVILFGLFLASSCMAAAFLMTASVADPELYESITDPIIAYTGKKLEELSIIIVAVQEKASEKAEETSTYLSDKIEQSKESTSQYLESLKENIEEALKPEPEPLSEPEELVPPETQALGEALLSSPRDTADYAVTHFMLHEETGQELLTGGTHELVYFNQTDEQWGNYGHDSVSGYGCGPTTMAMVVSTLTEQQYDAQEMADIFVEEEFWAYKSGTYYSFAYGSGERFNLKVEPMVPENTTASILMQQLMSGKLAIALMGQGHFTNGGHFIVLRGSTLTGDVLVADPASRERSVTTWDPQLILDELSKVRSSGAPLWFFSPNPEAIPEEELLIPNS